MNKDSTIGIKTLRGGVTAAGGFVAAGANAALTSGKVKITARLTQGCASAAAWGCDLTHEYVKINGSYRT